MESPLDMFINSCFATEDERNYVRQKFQDYGVDKYEELNLTEDQELLKYGFKKLHIKKLRQRFETQQQLEQIPTFQPQDVNKPLSNAKFLGKQNGLDIYQYPLENFNTVEESQAKVLIVVGQTGSGKTTLLNFFINYIMGIRFEDTFRYVIIVENTGKTQAFSQTNDVSVYYIKGHNNNPPIKLVDTPGFGDTRGIEQDQKISKQIKEFFTTRIDSINAVCFVAQSSNNRLTNNQKYIFSQILEMYGKDVAENFICMLTFCDGGLPQVVAALTDQESVFSDLIPSIQKPWHLKFNSSALFEQNISDRQFNRKFWDIGMGSFSEFVHEKLLILPRKSLTQTKEVLKERERLEATIGCLQPQLQQGLSMMESMRDLLVQIKAKENEIEHTKGFKIKTTTPIIKKINLKVKEYTTNCQICNITCHFPCAYSNDADKINCVAMTDGNCTCCPLKCGWEQHSNMTFRFECIMEEIFVEAEDLKKQYMDASSIKSATTQILEGIEGKLVAIAQDCLVRQNIIIECINRLKEIALKPACFETQEEYIDLMIIQEKQDAKAGWQGRIRALEELKSKWKLVREAFNKQGYFKDIQKFIKSMKPQEILKDKTSCSIF